MTFYFFRDFFLETSYYNLYLNFFRLFDLLWLLFVLFSGNKFSSMKGSALLLIGLVFSLILGIENSAPTHYLLGDSIGLLLPLAASAYYARLHVQDINLEKWAVYGLIGFLVKAIVFYSISLRVYPIGLGLPWLLIYVIIRSGRVVPQLLLLVLIVYYGQRTQLLLVLVLISLYRPRLGLVVSLISIQIAFIFDNTLLFQKFNKLLDGGSLVLDGSLLQRTFENKDLISNIKDMNWFEFLFGNGIGTEYIADEMKWKGSKIHHAHNSYLVVFFRAGLINSVFIWALLFYRDYKSTFISLRLILVVLVELLLFQNLFFNTTLGMLFLRNEKKN